MFRRSSGIGVVTIAALISAFFIMAVAGTIMGRRLEWRHSLNFTAAFLAQSPRNGANRFPATKVGSAAQTDESMTMPLTAPLFVANAEFTSALSLVNASGLSTYADVVVRAPDGTQLAVQHVIFAPHSQQRVDIGALLLNNGIGAGAGSVVVMPSSDLKGPAILAVLSMTYLDSREGDFIDEELAMPTPTDSEVLRGVSDSSNRSPIVAITSLADAPQHVTVQCFGSNRAGFAKTLVLGAGQTALTDACSARTFSGSNLDAIWNGDGGRPGKVTAVALTSDGMPGSFAAFGLSPHQTREDRRFSSVTFSDPKTTGSSSTVFSGVPVGDVSLLAGRIYTPQISVANFSVKPAHVTIQYAISSEDKPSAQQVWNGTVLALHTAEVRLDNLQGDTNLRNSFIVASNGSPGDVIAKLTTETDGGMQEIEVLGKDANVIENGGGHPWSLENNTDSTLLLFNHSGQSQTVLVMISASKGGAPWTKGYTLSAMQTVALSIRDLIQNKVKDDSGGILPANASSGVAQWLVFGTGLIKGRILQSDPSTGMARNFSCGCYSTIAGAEWSPSGTTYLGAGTSGDNGGAALADLNLVYPGNCSGTFETWTTVGPPQFSNNYTSSASYTVQIANPSATYADVNALSTGSAWISDQITDNDYGCGASAGGEDEVISANISQNTSGQVSADDAASGQYQYANGTTSLGKIIAAGQINLGCAMGVETVATVNPSTYTGNIIIHRTYISQGLYENSTDVGGEKQPGTDDTSNAVYQDQNPQSGASAGKAYDLDAPLMQPVDSNTYRWRTNFYVYAALADGTRISPNYNFYVRFSCTKTSGFPGYQFVNDISGDNQIGTGTTKTTWNLQ